MSYLVDFENEFVTGEIVSRMVHGCLELCAMLNYKMLLYRLRRPSFPFLKIS